MTRFKLDPMIVEEEGLTALLESAVHDGMRTGKKAVRTEHIEEVIINLDDDDGSTLVGAAGDIGQKEIEMEVNDNYEEDGLADGDVDSVIDLDADPPFKSNADGTGIKRKRTIRVIIRSRAFL